MDSKRIEKFREEIIKDIPRVPNNKDSLNKLKSKNLTDLLIIYVNWKIRFVSQRKRDVIIEQTAKADKRWVDLKDKIETFLEKVRNGDDLTPYLSLLAGKNGFTLAAESPATREEAWDDKDFLLNVMGYHHFHLGELKPGQYHAERTNEVLFASVKKDTFTVLAILDHSAFEKTVDHTVPMTKDREYLWKLSDDRSKRSVLPNGLYLHGMVMLSGHKLEIVILAQEYVRLIKEIDPKLDDIEFVRTLFKGSGLEIHKKTEFRWTFNHLNLCIFDKRTGYTGVYKWGPN